MRTENVQVRSLLAERLVVGTETDPFLDRRALGEYASLSVRTLARHLEDRAHPLPHFTVGGKILVRRSEFDRWVEAFRRQSKRDVASIVNDVLGKFRS